VETLFKSLKKYLILRRNRRSEFLYFHILSALLCATFAFYWLNPNSRRAHFGRVGTLESPIIKFVLPLSAFVFSLGLMYISLLLISRTYHHVQQRFDAGALSPVVLFISLVACPYFLAYFGLSLVSDLYYRILRVSNIEPTFADLRTILYGISCHDVHALGDVITCDPREGTTIWNYPTILLRLRALGLGIDYLLILAVMFTGIIAVACYLVAKDLGREGRNLLSIVIFSPPVLLCFDRMNFDLLIVSLVVIAIKLISKSQRHPLGLFFALCLLSLASILKFYAFPILIVITLLCFVQKIYPLLSVIVSATTFAVMAADLTSVREYIGRDVSGSVGFNVLISLLNGATTASIELLSLGFILGICLISSLLLLFVVHIREFTIVPERNLTSISLSFLFLLPWLTTSSYYYRLVVIVFLVPFFFTQYSRKFEKGISILAVCSLYLSPVSLALVQNILLAPLVSVQIIKLFLFFFSFKKLKGANMDG